MIQNIVEFALRQRGLILAACLALIALGVNAFMNLPIEAYPDVADTWVQIITQWPGHAAEEVERQITLPVERQMNGVPKQTAVRSTSIAGLSVVTLIFEDGTDSYFARQMVTGRLGQIDLPDGAQVALGPLASPVGEILRYNLVNCAQTKVPECEKEDLDVPPKPLSELKDLEEWVVERELLATPGVADVASFGGTLKQYQVLIDPSLLSARGLTVQDVEDALTAANGNAGGGVVRFGPAALNVRGIGLLTPEQIGDVAVTSRDGTPIRVRHVAKVQIGYQPRMGRVSIDNDKDVVKATVLLRKGEQAETVLERVHEHIEVINHTVLPRGVKMHIHHDRTELMHLTTHTVMHNLMEGIGLVTLILFIFLGNVRAAMIVAITIPLSLLIAFIFMDLSKIPANLLSIGAVDFGMIVDGSIVMVENIFRLIAEKQEHNQRYDLQDLVKAASKEVSRPIVFAIAIIVTAYLPIFTLQRVEGKLFSPMAWTVAFALFGALVLAITLVPVLTTFLFKGKIKEFNNPLLSLMRWSYLPTLRTLLKRPWIAFVVAGLLIGADAIMASHIGSEFLPHLDEGALWVRVSMPANISLAESEAMVDGRDEPPTAGEAKGKHTRGLRAILAEFPEVRMMSTQIGRPDDGTDPTGFYNAEFLLLLTDHEVWRPKFHGKKDELIQAMSEALSVVPGVEVGFSQPISDNVEEAVSGVKGQLCLKIIGNDLNALDDLARKAAHAMRDIQGIEDLGIFRELGQSNIHVAINRARAERYGLTVQEVEKFIEAGVGGKPVTEIVEGERRHDLVVRYEEEKRDTIDALRRLPVPLKHDGVTVPLAMVADVTVEGGASRIFREANRRYIAIKFSVRDRDLGSAVAEAQAKVDAAIKLPTGYNATWAGEFESAR